MNTKQALTRLNKLLGPKAALQDARRESSPEQRAIAHAARLAVNERRKVCEEALVARRDALLEADVEYQRLRADYTAARDAQRNSDIMPFYRYTAGTTSGIGFFVKAEADTLAELIEKVEAETAKRAAA